MEKWQNKNIEYTKYSYFTFCTYIYVGEIIVDFITTFHIFLGIYECRAGISTVSASMPNPLTRHSIIAVVVTVPPLEEEEVSVTAAALLWPAALHGDDEDASSVLAAVASGSTQSAPHSGSQRTNSAAGSVTAVATDRSGTSSR